MPELTPEGQVLFQRMLSEVPDIDRHPGLRQALATLIARGNLQHIQGSAAAVRSPELELLRRRANKLMRELRNARTELTRAEQRVTQDSGLASRYREVQGISAGEEHADAKRGMLEDIFRANLELRREAS